MKIHSVIPELVHVDRQVCVNFGNLRSTPDLQIVADHNHLQSSHSDKATCKHSGT
jgi:hypothetical protein